MPQPLKGNIADLVSSDVAVRALRPSLLRGGATIFTLHRFAHPQGDPDATSGDWLDACLTRLSELGFVLTPIWEIVAALKQGKRLSRHQVAFTVDDGYFDFAEVAAPIFQKHKCPVTVFLISGFLDSDNWNWWDRASLAGHRDFETLKLLPTEEREATIEGVPLFPVPQKYRPMSWSDVRSLEKQGVSFAPHTVSHPILARSSDVSARLEITQSWKRLQDEVSKPVPVLAYPNGQPNDFGSREIGIMKSVGLMAAVTTSPGHVRSAANQDLYRLPRIDLPNDHRRLGQILSGLEVAKSALRAKMSAI